MNNSSTNQPSYPHHKVNMNSSVYNQFNIDQDRTSSNTCSSSCNYPHYSHSTKLTLPSPVAHLPLSATNKVTMTPTRKVKVNMPKETKKYWWIHLKEERKRMSGCEIMELLSVFFYTNH